MTRREAPRFWWAPTGWQARLLAPAAAIYGAAARRNLNNGKRAEAGVPVLCVGNFTVGGGGKTPTVMALGAFAQAAGYKPGFLSRGHGGAIEVPTLVDPGRHDAQSVGDEPLLLAAIASTVVARDRAAGAKLLREDAGCDFVIMDDGFQSARLAVDFALLVVDASRGLGNEAVVPAGPLRAPIEDQLRHADALLVVGEGNGAEPVARLAVAVGRPVHRAQIVPRNPHTLTGRPLLAFAGIADPGKFYRSLEAIGADLRETRDFPDHHPFSDSEIADLGTHVAVSGLTLATTAKDAARLRVTPAGRRLLREALVLEIELALAPEIGAAMIRETAEAFARRRP